MAAFAALALSPDLDFITMEMGLGDTPLDHRVLTHSFAFALVMGSLIGLLAHRGMRLLGSSLFVLALASHGILDAMAQSEPGPQLFWPFLKEPIVAFWRPIPGTDFYQTYFTPEAIPIFVGELAVSLPLLAAAGWVLMRRPRAAARSGVMAPAYSDD